MQSKVSVDQYYLTLPTTEVSLALLMCYLRVRTTELGSESEPSSDAQGPESPCTKKACVHGSHRNSVFVYFQDYVIESTQ